MRRVHVVCQPRRDGSGLLWVHARHGWRRIEFARGGLLAALAKLGGATCTPLDGPLPVPLACPGPPASPLVPRAGPAAGPVQIAGP